MSTDATQHETLMISRETLGYAILEALNTPQNRNSWHLLLSSIDTLSDLTAMQFRDRLFTLLNEKFPVRLLAELSTINLRSTDDLLADLYQFVEGKQAAADTGPTYNPDDSQLMTRIVEMREALSRTLGQNKTPQDQQRSIPETIITRLQAQHFMPQLTGFARQVASALIDEELANGAKTYLVFASKDRVRSENYLGCYSSLETAERCTEVEMKAGNWPKDLNEAEVWTVTEIRTGKLNESGTLKFGPAKEAV